MEKINDMEGKGIELEKKLFEISDDELNTVVGGFGETNKNLSSAGYQIKCPKCGATAASSFEAGTWQDNTQHTTEYHCNCGAKFVVKDGYVIMKDAWIDLCNKKGYKYPFA